MEITEKNVTSQNSGGSEIYRFLGERNLYQWRVGMLSTIFKSYTICLKEWLYLKRINFREDLISQVINFQKSLCRFIFAKNIKFERKVFIFLSILKFFSFSWGLNFTENVKIREIRET